MSRRKFDAEKAIEVLLYITERCPDMYHALKILYFADRKHLSRYGRLVCDDSYVAMRLGPVPSGSYDLIKYARGDGLCRWYQDEIDESFTIDNNHQITPLREPNLEYLSETDIECLDEAIAEYGPLSFGELKRASHDQAYHSANENDFISLESLVKSLPDSDALLDYLRSR